MKLLLIILIFVIMPRNPTPMPAKMQVKAPVKTVASRPTITMPISNSKSGFSKDSPARAKFNAAQLGGYASNKKK